MKTQRKVQLDIKKDKMDIKNFHIYLKFKKTQHKLIIFVMNMI